jgi:hypothetical protein
VAIGDFLVTIIPGADPSGWVFVVINLLFAIAFFVVGRANMSTVTKWDSISYPSPDVQHDGNVRRRAITTCFTEYIARDSAYYAAAFVREVRRAAESLSPKPLGGHDL